MATTQGVPLFSTDPNVQAQAALLQQQQAMAQALMQHGLTPLDTTNRQVGGVAYSVSPFEGLAKMLQTYVGQQGMQDSAYRLGELGSRQVGSMFGLDNATPDPSKVALALGSQSQTPVNPSMPGYMQNEQTRPDVGPTNTNAALAQSLSQTPLPQSPGPLSYPGLGNAQSARMYMASPEAYMKALLSRQDNRTDFTKTMISAGIDPESALGRQLIQSQVAKQNYIEPVIGRAGSFIRDPISMKPLAFNPNLTQGSMPLFDASGNVVSNQPILGAPQTVMEMSGSEAVGKAFGQVEKGFDANGNPAYVPQGPIALNAWRGSQGAPGSQNQTGSPFGGPSAFNSQSSPTGVAPSLAPEEQAARSEVGQTSAKQLLGDQQNAGAFANRIFNLSKALSGLQNADTGPGSQTLQTAKSWLLARTDLAKYLPGIDPNRIASWDEANKYLTQVAIGQASSLGQSTNEKLAAVLSGNANTNISNLASQDVVRANMALERMNQAAVIAFQQTGQSAAKYAAWKSNYSTRIDPRVFLWNDLPQDKKASVARTMTPQERQTFTQQYNWALGVGVLNSTGPANQNTGGAGGGF